MCVGGQATATGNNAPGGWNGGGNASSSPSAGGGGGASDIRTIGGSWDDPASLNSRLMVAGGGGAGFSGEIPAGEAYRPSENIQPVKPPRVRARTLVKEPMPFTAVADTTAVEAAVAGMVEAPMGTRTGAGSGGSSYYGGLGVTQGSTLPGVHSGPGTVTISW